MRLGATTRRLMVLASVAVTIVVLVLLLDKDSTHQVDSEAIGHVRAACDVTGKAGVAAQVDSPERYAAASILLDRAIVESGRAAGIDPVFTDLDAAVQAVHTAAHGGRRDSWLTALSAAVRECDRALAG